MVPVGFVNVASIVLAVWSRSHYQVPQLFFRRSGCSLTQERQTLLGSDGIVLSPFQQTALVAQEH